MLKKCFALIMLFMLLFVSGCEEDTYFGGYAFDRIESYGSAEVTRCNDTNSSFGICYEIGNFKYITVGDRTITLKKDKDTASTTDKEYVYKLSDKVFVIQFISTVENPKIYFEGSEMVYEFLYEENLYRAYFKKF